MTCCIRSITLYMYLLFDLCLSAFMIIVVGHASLVCLMNDMTI
jgi:hypothetical protein